MQFLGDYFLLKIYFLSILPILKPFFCAKSQHNLHFLNHKMDFIHFFFINVEKKSYFTKKKRPSKNRLAAIVPTVARENIPL